MLFLALDPDDALADLTLAYKRRVQALVGQQLFVDHPPHVTVYLAAFDDPSLVSEAAERMARRLPAPQARIVGWHVFWSDKLTGNHTLVLQLDEGDVAALRKWQREAIAALAPLRNLARTEARYADHRLALSDVERRAIREHGFPYAGDHWQPHVTIASIRPSDWPRVERDLLRETPALTATFPTATLYRLDGEHPVSCRRYSLARRSEPCNLKRSLVAALGRVAGAIPWVDSATLAGSFLTSPGLEGISDIDFIVVVDHLDAARFAHIQSACRMAIAPILAAAGYDLRINPTLGPLKLNDERTAVLHLMLYSRAAHVEHVLHSPFTCFDWQRSATWFKQPLADVFPALALMPRHFLSARRGPSDYLRDLGAGRVSYRELECTADGYREASRERPMDRRDRIEFAWHIVRFLIQNLVKLIRRRNEAIEGPPLCDAYLDVFGDDVDATRALFAELAARKLNADFGTLPDSLDGRLERFVAAFERQFRREFVENATRHIAFRHAPTAGNRGRGDSKRFLGRTDLPIEEVGDAAFERLVESLGEEAWEAAYVSPQTRCQQTYAHLARAAEYGVAGAERSEAPAGPRTNLPPPTIDARLIEINYGQCENLTVAEARNSYPHLFAAWNRNEDPPFPAGESTGDVLDRVTHFIADRWQAAKGNTIVCTHNVVLRTLVGKTLNVPSRLWHRLNISHLAPIEFIQTKNHGLFANLEEQTLRTVLADFLPTPFEALRKSA